MPLKIELWKNGNINTLERPSKKILDLDLASDINHLNSLTVPSKIYNSTEKEAYQKYHENLLNTRSYTFNRINQIEEELDELNYKLPILDKEISEIYSRFNDIK